MERYLKPQIVKDLNKKMVFLAGPRQVGKTTLSQSLTKNIDYMNWDIDKDRSRILNKEFKDTELWVFDEIHKYKVWRNYFKGIFDEFKNEKKILVTGSAKLDLLRKGAIHCRDATIFQAIDYNIYEDQKAKYEYLKKFFPQKWEEKNRV